jgi:hypothetical protein
VDVDERGGKQSASCDPSRSVVGLIKYSVFEILGAADGRGQLADHAISRGLIR